MMKRAPFALLLALVTLSCGGGADPAGRKGLEVDAGPSAPPGASSAVGPSPSPPRAEPCGVPSTTAALVPYLESGAYRSLPHESRPHASTGPHGGNVQTYITPALEASLRAGNSEHPQCAAMVKELFGGGTTVTGWAVAVKKEPTSAAGANWYWYEGKGLSAGFQGDGVALCTACHSGGTDFVLTPFPLR